MGCGIGDMEEEKLVACLLTLLFLQVLLLVTFVIFFLSKENIYSFFVLVRLTSFYHPK